MSSKGHSPLGGYIFSDRLSKILGRRLSYEIKNLRNYTSEAKKDPDLKIFLNHVVVLTHWPINNKDNIFFSYT